MFSKFDRKCEVNLNDFSLKQKEIHVYKICFNHRHIISYYKLLYACGFNNDILILRLTVKLYLHNFIL